MNDLEITQQAVDAVADALWIIAVGVVGGHREPPTPDELHDLARQLEQARPAIRRMVNARNQLAMF